MIIAVQVLSVNVPIISLLETTEVINSKPIHFNAGPGSLCVTAGQDDPDLLCPPDLPATCSRRRKLETEVDSLYLDVQAADAVFGL